MCGFLWRSRGEVELIRAGWGKCGELGCTKAGLEIRMIILGWTMREANINTDSVVDNLLRVYRAIS
jgi:hypothetical protein